MLNPFPAAMNTIATPGVGGVAPLKELLPQHSACPSPPLIPQLCEAPAATPLQTALFTLPGVGLGVGLGVGPGVGGVGLGVGTGVGLGVGTGVGAWVHGSCNRLLSTNAKFC